MSKRQIDPAEKAKQAAARKGIAALRRASAQEAHISVTDRDARTLRAVIEYMRERDPRIADYLCRIGSATPAIRPVIETLPWNPAAPARIVELVLTEKSPAHYQGYGRQRKLVPGEATYEYIPVPHWDYDGVDPLIAREPWERDQADASLDHDEGRAPWARDAWRTLSTLDHDASEMEAAERLNAAHGDTRFAYATGPEG
jgi:hypothetical protein